MGKKIPGKLMLLMSFIMVFVSCKKEQSSPLERSYDLSIKDKAGRTLILHGLNTSGSAKHAADHLPWIREENVENELVNWGFNSVRFLIFWGAIEPEKGQYDERYLNEVEKRVRWYTDRGMYVLLDMHQDVYGYALGGNGAPAWATETNGHSYKPLEPGQHWGMAHTQPAVMYACQNFFQYTAHKYLQDHYINAFKKVAERFRDNPYVIGYDLMNEPGYLDIPGVYLTGKFESVLLTDFYHRLIPAIRSVEPDKYLFFEPTALSANIGGPSHLKKIRDSRPATSRLVYAPHCYTASVESQNPYSAVDKRNLRDWSRQRQKDIRLQKCPLYVGEFGVHPESEGFDLYLTDLMNMVDSLNGSWAYWSNDQGWWAPLTNDLRESDIAGHLVRTYPRATAGDLKKFSYDPSTGIFKMSFINDPSISLPTEIFIPQRYYLNGWNIEVSTDDYTQQWDERLSLLRLKFKKRAEVSITIRPA